MTILTIDVGSSSARVMLFDDAGHSVQHIPDASVQDHYSFDHDADGQATIDAVTLRERLEALIDAALQHPAAQTIKGVGMDTFVGNLLLLDEGEAASPLYTYADTQCKAEVSYLRAQVDEAAAHQRTGTPLNTAYHPARLRWLSNRGVTAKRCVDFATYCYQTWFKREVPASYSVSSWSGLFKRATLAWDAEWLAHLHLDVRHFPQLADYRQAQYGLSANYARRWPQLAQTPFFLAVGDGAAAQVGSGAIAADTLALTVGTTAALRRVSTEGLPQVPQGLWSYRVDAAHHLLGGALSEGGNIFTWATQTLRLDEADIEAELQQREPGAHGLTVLPMLNGERSPGWWAGASGTIHGLRIHSTPMDICHALLESVALRIASIAEQLNVDDSVQIMASGGALHASAAWARLIASAIGQALHLLDEPQISALGVAQMVTCALREQPLTGASPRIAQTIPIYPDEVAKLQVLKQKQAQLYAILRQNSP